MEVALDLLQLRSLLAAVLGVRIWFFGRLLVQVDLLLLNNFMPGRHARSENITGRKRLRFLGFGGSFAAFAAAAASFAACSSALSLSREARCLAFSLALLRRSFSSLASFFLSCFSLAIYARQVRHFFCLQTEGVAEVGAVLLACARRRVGGVEVARRRGDGVCVSMMSRTRDRRRGNDSRDAETPSTRPRRVQGRDVKAPRRTEIRTLLRREVRSNSKAAGPARQYRKYAALTSRGNTLLSKYASSGSHSNCWSSLSAVSVQRFVSIASMAASTAKRA